MHGERNPLAIIIRVWFLLIQDARTIETNAALLPVETQQLSTIGAFRGNL